LQLRVRWRERYEVRGLRYEVLRYEVLRYEVLSLELSARSRLLTADCQLPCEAWAREGAPKGRMGIYLTACRQNTQTALPDDGRAFSISIAIWISISIGTCCAVRSGEKGGPARGLFIQSPAKLQAQNLVPRTSYLVPFASANSSLASDTRRQPGITAPAS
jgi:hypothetical protein